MFSMSIPWWEFLVRAVVVYGFLLLLLRVGGKRQLGQLSPFDFVLMLVVSNALQNSMNGGDNSLVGGMISAGVLAAVNLGVAWYARRNRRMEHMLEGVPKVLVHNGKVFDCVLRHENISRNELDAALRGAGALEASEVHLAMLEVSGHITVHLRKSA